MDQVEKINEETANILKDIFSAVLQPIIKNFFIEHLKEQTKKLIDNTANEIKELQGEWKDFTESTKTDLASMRSSLEQKIAKLHNEINIDINNLIQEQKQEFNKMVNSNDKFVDDIKNQLTNQDKNQQKTISNINKKFKWLLVIVFFMLIINIFFVLKFFFKM